MSKFFDRLRDVSKSHHSQISVGLDPDPGRIPGGLNRAVAYCIDVVQATARFACAYKANSAFWEQYGVDGWRGLYAVRSTVPTNIPVIFDAKRSDVPRTMEAYAEAAFNQLEMDAITLHAHHGCDTLAVFAKHQSRGIFVVARSSNIGALDLQELETPVDPLYAHVVRVAMALNKHENIGVVMGGTAPEAMKKIRALYPEAPFLIPGIGAQGGDIEASVKAAWNGDPASCILAPSSSVMYAEDPGRAVDDMRVRVNSLLTTALADHVNRS